MFKSASSRKAYFAGKAAAKKQMESGQTQPEQELPFKLPKNVGVEVPKAPKFPSLKSLLKGRK